MANKSKIESRRRWLSGLSITLTTVICFFGFWHLAPGLTFLVAIGALIALTFSLWWSGKES